MIYTRLDYDLSLLKEIVHLIDRHLDEIIHNATQVDDAESFGYFDSAEHIIGLGFVACQTYMSSVYGYLRIDKQKALSVGPLHSSGQTKVRIINHAANYWKHNNEWSLDNNNKQKKYVEEAFESVGFPVDTDYPLSGVLAEIVFSENAGFEAIIHILELWQKQLQETAKQ
jgi:hypothetical protein